jgi:hypothetical protein
MMLFSSSKNRCGRYALVHTTHSWLLTALSEIITEVSGALGVGVEVLKNPTMLVQLPKRNDAPPPGCKCLSLSRHPRLKTCS